LAETYVTKFKTNTLCAAHHMLFMSALDRVKKRNGFYSILYSMK